MTASERELLSKFGERLARIEQAVCGNGSRGLDERVACLEEAEDKKKSYRLRARALDVAVIVAAVTVLDLVLRGLKVL